MGRCMIIVRRIAMCLGWVIERAGNDSFANQFSTYILQPCGASHEGYITLDTYGAPRVSGGMCLGLYDLLLIGEMVRNRGYANGREVVPASWIDDIFAVRDNHIWRAKISPKAPVFSLMAITDHYGTRPGLKIRKFAPLAFMVNGCGSTRKNSW